jgi:hypothetical protein
MPEHSEGTPKRYFVPTSSSSLCDKKLPRPAPAFFLPLRPNYRTLSFTQAIVFCRGIHIERVSSLDYRGPVPAPLIRAHSRVYTRRARFYAAAAVRSRILGAALSHVRYERSSRSPPGPVILRDRGSSRLETGQHPRRDLIVLGLTSAHIAQRTYATLAQPSTGAIAWYSGGAAAFGHMFSHSMQDPGLDSLCFVCGALSSHCDVYCRPRFLVMAS